MTLLPRYLAAILAVVVAWTVTAAPSAADPDLVGDVEAPVLRSFSIAPATGDATLAPAEFKITWRITDDKTGVTPERTQVSWSPPGGGSSHGTTTVRTAGDDLDGTYEATMVVPRGYPPGRYTVWLTFGDRVGNGRSYPPEELAAAGHPSGVDISNSDPDDVAPLITGVEVTPGVVDVRGGPGAAAVSVSVADTGTGVADVVVFLRSPDGSGGGVEAPVMRLASGTSSSGSWSGRITFPKHTVAGWWGVEVRAADQVGNGSVIERDAVVEVLSDEDADAPVVVTASILPAEVNVHHEDQTVTVRLRATDAIVGVEHIWDGYHNVQLYATDPVTRQEVGLGAMRLVEGTAMDGWYEGTLVVRRSSATGLRPIRLHISDEVQNSRILEGAALVAVGSTPTLLVYNVPLPPILRDVVPTTSGLEVRWDPPTDDRGAEVTRYVVRESPDGVVVEAPADARSIPVPGLRPGVTHTFTVSAVNRAGESEPSTERSAKAPSAGTGYWMVDEGGDVHAFGDAVDRGDAPSTTPVVDIAATPSRQGYWVVDSAGGVHARGDAPFLGRPSLHSGERATSLSATSTGKGYWVFTDRGRAFAFGDAPWLGDLSGVALNAPVLDSATTPNGQGYWMVAEDGGVFTFGTARFSGSTGGTRLNAPVRSLVPAPSGGYWLVAGDGGIFSFGGAAFHGSLGGIALNRPVRGMVASSSGGGYLMVGEDGGIFTFGDVVFRGSLGGRPPAQPVVAVAPV